MSGFVRRNALLLILAVLGLLGLAGALVLRENSFPVATVNFRLLRPEAEQMARTYLAERGFSLVGYRSAVAFEVDDATKEYLHQKLGLAELNRLAAEEVSVWRWRVRFFRELEQEELGVLLTPDGRTVGFWHEVPESLPGADPQVAEAQAIAESALVAGGRQLGDYRLVSASAVRREARTDHLFTWEERAFAVDEATYRIDVWVHGDRVGGFYEYLKLPEVWLRARALEANHGSLLALVGWTLTYGLGLATAFVCLLRLRSGAVRWRFALALAVALAAIGLGAGINSLPLLLIDYPTTATIGAYFGERLQTLIGSAVPTGIVVVLAGIAGDWLYGDLLPRRLPPHALFSRRGFSSAEFVTAVLAGYAVAGIWLGYVTGFYTVAGEFFGAWSPAELPYRDLMSTLLPALYPLTVGFGAAVSEESLFRLFAVPFCLWLGLALAGRSTWLRERPAWLALAKGAVAVVAVVGPALVWGTLHATYPQRPFYIRALELTIAGGLSALLMFRFGIVATITSHYVYNASVIGGLFILSGSPYLQASALVVVLLPLATLLPAAARRLHGGALLPAVAVAGEHALAAPRPAVPRRGPAAPRSAWPFRRRRLLELAVLGVLSAAIALAWSVPRLGDDLRLQIGRAEAAARSQEMARQLGFTPEAWHSVSTFGDWSVGNHTTYLLRRLGTAATSRFLADELPSYIWETRFFRPLEKTEFVIRFDQDGTLHSFDHRLPEDAPGGRLGRAEAQALAEQFVRERGRAEALAWDLVTAVSVERKGRTDHVFEWENRVQRIDEAAFRLRVAVKGDHVGELTPYLKLPEAFEREMAKRSEADVALDLLRQGIQLAVFGTALTLFVLRFRRDQIDLRFAAAAAAVPAAWAIVSQINALPAFFAGYWTTIELAGYGIWQTIGLVRSVAGDAVWHLVLFGVAASLYEELFPQRPGPGEQLRAILRPGRDALVAGCFALALAPVVWLVLAAYRAAREALAARSLIAEALVPSGQLNAAWPSVAVAGDNLSFAVWLVLGATGITLWLWRTLRRPWLAALVWVVGLTLFYAISFADWEYLAVDSARWAVLVGLVYLAAARYVGGNLFAYGLAAYTFLAGREALHLLAQPQQTYALHGALALALAVLPALVLVGRGLAGARAEADEEREERHPARHE